MIFYYGKDLPDDTLSGGRKANNKTKVRTTTNLKHLLENYDFICGNI